MRGTRSRPGTTEGRPWLGQATGAVSTGRRARKVRRSGSVRGARRRTWSPQATRRRPRSITGERRATVAICLRPY